jgi:hypothetical protein
MVRKFIFKVLGSPLPGTGTNYMGPVVNAGIDQGKLITAIEVMCRRERLVYFELCNDLFSSDIMTLKEFHIGNSITHKIVVADDEESAFNNLRSTCRNRIRKGQKNRLKAEKTNDPGIVDVFFDQYKEVYGKQGKTTPFDIGRVRSLYECLHPSKRLLAVWVRNNDGKVLATGLFPYDENAIYFWGAASWLKYHKFSPNELLHWEVIKFAVQHKIKEYNMCGGGSQFKNKFGGDDVPHIKYYKSLSKSFYLLRRFYKKWHFFKLNLTPKYFKNKTKRIG